MKERWSRFWDRSGGYRATGASGRTRLEAGSLFENLRERYAEPHRRYHTLEHIGSCLEEYARCERFLRYPLEVEAAIWFHDAIYAPDASDNEEKSAGLAAALLARSGYESPFILRTGHLILSTRHSIAVALPLELLTDIEYLQDIDLAVLGMPEDRYERYESGIRHEYGSLTPQAFRSGRGEFLQSMLDQGGIFRTELFRGLYEQQAKANIRRVLDRLGSLQPVHARRG